VRYWLCEACVAYLFEENEIIRVRAEKMAHTLLGCTGKPG